MEPSSTSSQHICEACSQLEGLAPYSTPDVQEWASVKRNQHIYKTEPSSLTDVCAVCEFFRRLPSVPWETSCLTVTLVYGHVMPGYEHLGAQVRTSDPFPWACFTLYTHQRRGRLEHETHRDGVVVFTPHSRSSDLDPYPIKSVSHLSVDWNVLRSRLDSCQERHSRCNLENILSGRLPYIYLIDCLTNTIVKADSSVTYIALSYV